MQIYRPKCKAKCGASCCLLRITVTHCNTLQRTATHCNTLQHTAAHCSTLQHTATLYNIMHSYKYQYKGNGALPCGVDCCLMHIAATLCRKLQHTATYIHPDIHTCTYTYTYTDIYIYLYICIVNGQSTVNGKCGVNRCLMHITETHCSTLQHSATYIHSYIYM